MAHQASADDISSDLGDLNQTVAITPIEVSKTINDLDDVCLIKIFSNKSLTSIDLCSLAETCKRFKKLVQGVFPEEFHITSQTFISSWFTSMDYCTFFGGHDCERILKNFGSRLVAFRVDETNEFVANSVVRYCGDVTLKLLEIHGMRKFQFLLLQLRPIFRRLLTLSIVGCDFRNLKCRPISCDSLVALEIVQTEDCNKILKNNFPNLERFIFRYDAEAAWLRRTLEETDIISSFIGRHRRLRTLNLFGSSINCSSKLVEAIGKGCGQLEELTIKTKRRRKSYEVLNRLSLPKLSRLEVVISLENCYQIVSLLQASSSLETVTLYFEDTVLLPVVNVLSELQYLREMMLICHAFYIIPWTKLTQLKKLSLMEPGGRFFRSSDLFNIIRELTSLEELEIISFSMHPFLLHHGEFSQIVKIVEERSHILTLKCRSNFMASSVENQKVRLIQ